MSDARLTRSGTVSDAPVAHSVEQRTFNPRVRRSKLRGGTTSPSLTDLPARMQAKIQLEVSPVAGLPGLCWAWTGALTSRGYGCVSIDGKRRLAHRATYQLLVAPIVDDLELDHLCENKVCCNPLHTDPVTGLINTRRARLHTFYCAQGHPLAGRNVVTRTRAHDGYERRTCRICQYEWQRQRYQRRNPHARSRSFATKRDAILADTRQALAESLRRADVDALLNAEAAS